MAGTAPYASAARRIADEILDSVENDEDVRTATETAVQTMTLLEWIEFRAAAADEIANFASATPSARRRRRWKTPPHLLSLGAYQFCLEAARLLDEIDLLRPGGSYRGMLYTAGMAAHQVWNAMDDILLQGYHGEPLPFRKD